MPMIGQQCVAIMPDEQERTALTRLADLLEGSAGLALEVEGAHRVAVPPTVAAILQQISRQLANGHGVALVLVDRELTTQQAADLLNVSRPHLVRLVESGEIPFTRTGKHRRVHLEDILSYRERRRSERRRNLDDLVRLSEEAGLYRG